MEAKLDFDIDNINKNELQLLDCQVDLILRSLEFYAYTYQFIYPRRRKNFTKEENLRICLVRDTYEQIISSLEKPITRNTAIPNVFEDAENFFKKIA